MTQTVNHSAVIFSPHWKSAPRQAAKRLIDALGASLLLIALSPIFVVLAIVVKRSSAGNIFYRWRVVTGRQTVRQL